TWLHPTRFHARFIAMTPCSVETRPACTATDRGMVRAVLMGSHSHETASGVRVHVWQRGGNFLARGSYLGQRFGETLGRDITEATARLRRLLNEIEDGSYVRPSDARQRPLSKGCVPRLTLRQLGNEYLSD